MIPQQAGSHDRPATGIVQMTHRLGIVARLLYRPRFFTPLGVFLALVVCVTFPLCLGTCAFRTLGLRDVSM